MGKIKKNVITKGFSGSFGDDLVFRQVDDRTVFAQKSENNSEPTGRQLQVRNKFLEATNYASAAVDNPQALEDYQRMAELQKLKSAYVAAVTDYLTMPEIGGVFTNAYEGAAGNMINMTSKYPHKITGINVTILKPDGSELESGEAINKQLKWRYTTTMSNAQVQGSKLVLKAKDRQGKESVLERVL
jgi:glucose-6-phosphate 1-dehydrogenase